MSDLISRKDAIDAIYANHVSTNPDDFSVSEKFIEFMDDTEISSFGNWQWANGFNTALVANKLSIEQLPPAESQWIPVSERLPENKTYVLTTISIPGRQPKVRSGWYEGKYFHNDNGDTWNATDMEVKAWMPQPKPYEGSD